MTDDELVRAAVEARTRAFAPYSRFQVGAALLDASGRVHLGANVENASYGLTICAERVALSRAYADGVRDVVAVAIVADTKDPIPPCGACRQVLLELAPRARILMANLRGAREVFSIDALLPRAFRL